MYEAEKRKLILAWLSPSTIHKKDIPLDVEQGFSLTRKYGVKGDRGQFLGP